MEVSTLDDRMHSNSVTLSTDKHSGPIATINHLLSADPEATCKSLRGPPDATVLYSCPFHSFSHWLHVWHLLLFLSDASLSAPGQTLSRGGLSMAPMHPSALSLREDWLGLRGQHIAGHFVKTKLLFLNVLT